MRMSISDFSVRWTGHLSAISRSRLRVGIEVAFQRDDALDTVQLTFLCFAFGAIAAIDPAVAQTD